MFKLCLGTPMFSLNEGDIVNEILEPKFHHLVNLLFLFLLNRKNIQQFLFLFSKNKISKFYMINLFLLQYHF